MYVFHTGEFFGLGMVLGLSLLGVSRKFEAEADQLGAQYAWRAGYDPRGFITFFDKMASEKGYVQSASFFRTHPPFFERILSTFSEIEYLPKSEALKVDSTEFRAFKQRLAQAVKKESSRTKRTNRPWGASRNATKILRDPPERARFCQLPAGPVWQRTDHLPAFWAAASAARAPAGEMGVRTVSKRALRSGYCFGNANNGRIIVFPGLCAIVSPISFSNAVESLY